MDQSTHDVRRANWLNIVNQCKERPANVSIKQWLADNGIKEKAYYYWLRKFRKEAYDKMQIPAVAGPTEMYLHTKNVNSYYFGEIGIDADNEGSILECRKRGFERLENTPDFLNGLLQEGSYGEMWSVRKVLRRFIWHDRIHAKAMWKMAKKTFEESEIEDVFFFD